MGDIMTTFPTSVSILGSTGSVGTQSLEVAKAHAIPVDLLTGSQNVALMEAQARAFMPKIVVMADPSAAQSLKTKLADTSILVYGGADAICQGIAQVGSHTVVNAILGEAGLLPTLAALGSAKRLALSNKESLVIAGDIVNATAKETGCEILPVDSEHSAIYQCLQGNRKSDVRRLYLTASGGPFFGYTKEQLQNVTLADTLAHPTWKMGKKITVDSATMMNKGFELIEAVHLFGVSPAQIEVLIHRESIIHSAVEYNDSSVIAELSVPDMRTCVAYALTFPARADFGGSFLDLATVGKLTFAKPDEETFPLLALAKHAIAQGGGVPACLNAANEVAVAAFLEEKITFCQIADVVLRGVEHTEKAAQNATSLGDILSSAKDARAFAESIL